ncbi:maleylacetoacetate isomerase [soil metagenome]
MKLHLDPKSSSCLRVISYAAFKGISYETAAVGTMKREHHSEAYLALNPAACVPALELDDGTVLMQSLAIIEWLEATHPLPAALPADELERAKVRGICGFIASEIHPVTNMRVRNEIARMNESDGDKGAAVAAAWCRLWTDEGVQALEGWLQRSAGAFSFGDAVGFADFFVAPMMFNAERFGCDLGEAPTVRRVYASCLEHPAFAALTEIRRAAGY